MNLQSGDFDGIGGRYILEQIQLDTVRRMFEAAVSLAVPGLVG